MKTVREAVRLNMHAAVNLKGVSDVASFFCFVFCEWQQLPEGPKVRRKARYYGFLSDSLSLSLSLFARAV